MNDLKIIEEKLNASTPAPWEATGNYPFYVDMKKPGPSLSKHDLDRPTYWSYPDAEFVLLARNKFVPEMLEEIKKLREENFTLKQQLEKALDK